MGKKGKQVWYECPSCHLEYHTFVKAVIVGDKLVPRCNGCGTNLQRRTKNG